LSAAGERVLVLTLHGAAGVQIAELLNRLAIGDRDDVQFDGDGSLDIYVQHEEHDSGTSNWLPAPSGSFDLCARLYYPEQESSTRVGVHPR
jgi:hypothetical protein